MCVFAFMCLCIMCVVCVCVCACVWGVYVLSVCVCVFVCVCGFFFKLSMLHYNWVTLHAISHNVSYRGDVVLVTHFTSPLGHVVFVIVGQSLLILQRLETSPDAS